MAARKQKAQATVSDYRMVDSVARIETNISHMLEAQKTLREEQKRMDRVINYGIGGLAVLQIVAGFAIAFVT